jgi:hypothetical protein
MSAIIKLLKESYLNEYEENLKLHATEFYTNMKSKMEPYQSSSLKSKLKLHD